MKTQRLAIALTAINLLFLLFAMAQAGNKDEKTVSPIIQARAFELVDDKGQIRSRLNVEQNGEVVFRLLDKNGTIRVKLGAGEDGSGMVLLDEATEPGIHMIARRTSTPERPLTTGITLKSGNGQPHVIKP